MAFEVKDDKKKKLEAGAGDPNAGVQQLTSADGALQAGGTEGVSTDVGGGPATPTAPTGGQNVSQQQKYMDVNKAKALQLAGKTAGVIESDVSAAQTALTGAGEQYQAAVKEGTIGLDQDIYQRATSALTDQTAIGYDPNAVSQFMGSEEDVAAFQKQYGAQYGGPRDIQSQDYYAQAKRDAEKAQRTMGLTGDLTGRQELIGRTYDNQSGRFSRGTLALDEALLSGNQEAYQRLLEASDQGLGLEGQMTGLGEMSEREYLAAMETTDATRKAMQEQFNLTGEEQEIRTQTKAIQEKAKTDYDDYLKYVQDTYGVQEGVQATSYFDRPQDYLNIQAQNVMSNEDVARMRALQDLTEKTGTLTPFAEQAGQYKDYIDPSQDFRQTDFEGKVASEKGARIAREQAESRRLAAIEEAKRAADRAAKEQKLQSQATAVGAVGGAVVGGVIGGPVGAAVGGFVGGAVGGAIGGWCFHPNTLVKMEDGTLKRIKNIKVGDTIHEGGKVYSVSSHLNNTPMFYYLGTLVTGGHAVQEYGEWKRVKDSLLAVTTNKKSEVVHTLSSENHRICTKGTTFADYDEVDNPEGLTDAQCLKILKGEK